MENSVDTTWNSESSTHCQECGTPESRSTAIYKDLVVSSRTEGTMHNHTPYLQWIEPIPDDPLTLIVNNKRTHYSILDTSESAVRVYDRETMIRRRVGVPEVEGNAGDWGQSLECSSIFPTEIYEAIIDCVAARGYPRNISYLARCARVCRAWVPRAQMHLFSAIIPWSIETFKYVTLTGFQDAVRRKPFLLQYIKVLFIFPAYNDKKMPRRTTLLSSYYMPSLKRCCISGLDLKEEHPSLSRFPSSATSVQSLELYRCKTGDVNQLCRFLTSFRSLSIVLLTWSLEKALGGHDLPHLQFNRSKCSLRTLALVFTPGISALLKSFLKARPFVSHLRHLIISYSSPMIPSFPLRGITELLQHCSQSLEEVTVTLGFSWTEIHQSVSSFRILSNQPVPDTETSPLADEIECLDDILSGEMFRSFRKLHIKALEMGHIEFPKLKERNVDVDVVVIDRLKTVWISF
ncbi:hypothetical protein QCA50_012527 [Cerrena zonata]|uniref:F-box domain-containing protein n=1 Tax=Cerrena zonata TaxID=2478898 RepID=A0AAW0FRD3_9APHY